MRLSLLFFIIINVCTLANGQNGQNPFDLDHSKENETIETIEKTEPTVNQNPFNLGPASQNQATTPKVAPKKQTKTNPFDLSTAPQKATKPVISVPAPQAELSTNNATEQKGVILTLVLFTLSITALVFIFFRSLYSKIYKAIFSNNQLTLLYRERQAGAFGNFFIAYSVFFLNAGLFIYLTLIHLNILPAGEALKNYTIITLSIAGLFISKHLVLSLIAYVFPISKAVRTYSFTIMIFAIILGLALSLIGFIFAYASAGMKMVLLYFIGLLFLFTYLLRSLRALFIANRHVFNHLFHFLLYLCAVEIAPALIIYKMILSI